MLCFGQADLELTVPPKALHDVFAAVHRLRICQSQPAVAAVSAVPCREGYTAGPGLRHLIVSNAVRTGNWTCVSSDEMPGNGGRDKQIDIVTGFSECELGIGSQVALGPQHFME